MVSRSLGNFAGKFCTVVDAEAIIDGDGASSCGKRKRRSLSGPARRSGNFVSPADSGTGKLTAPFDEVLGFVPQRWFRRPRP
jgi:hypothetical protein